MTALAAVAFILLGAQLLGAQGQTRSTTSAAPASADALGLQAVCSSPASAGAQVCVSASAAPAVVPEAGLPVALGISGALAMAGAVALTVRRDRHPATSAAGR